MKLCLSASSLGLMAGSREEEMNEDAGSPALASALTAAFDVASLLDAEMLQVCQTWTAWEAPATRSRGL
jgi:hypothetical protein